MEYIFGKVLELSISSTVLIIIVIALRFLLKNSPKWVMGVLWGIVALKLIMPYQISRPVIFIDAGDNTSLLAGRLLNEETEKISINDSYNPMGIKNELANDSSNSNGDSVVTSVINSVEKNYLPEENASKITQDNKTRITISGYISIVWLIGMVLLLLYAFFSYFVLKNKTKVFIEKNRGVRVCDEIDTPFVMGIAKPIIYLPSGYDKDVIDNVLSHEMAHIHRFDHIRKQIAFLILSIHWFNPLVWVSFELFCRDIELACDEKAIKNMSFDEKKAYASALLECSVKKRLTYACPIAFGKIGVRTRVKQIFNYKKTSFLFAVIISVICILLCFLFFSIPEKNMAHDGASKELLDENNNEYEVLSQDDEKAEINTRTTFDYNHYYNVSIRECLNKVFVETDDGIYVADEGDSGFTKILNGIYMLGAADDDGIYICNVQSGDKQGCDLLYLDANTYSTYLLDKDINIINESSILHYSGMYIQDNMLYVEGDDKYVAYKILTNKVENNGVYSKNATDYFPMSAIKTAGIKNACLEDINESLVGKLTIDLNDECTVYADNVCDVLLTPFGAVYRKGNGTDIYSRSIYLLEYDTGEERIIYDCEKNSGFYLGYNTYDKEGFYGLQSCDEGNYKIVFCGWDGKFSELYSFSMTGRVLGTSLHMGIIDDWLYFRDPSDMYVKRINVQSNNIQIIQ